MNIYTFRQRKDEFFRTDPASPVEGEFEGLRYFPVSPSFVFTPELEPFASPERLELVTSVGDVEAYLRYGRVRFKVDGEHCTLTLFTQEDAPEHFFVPFKDATNGRETYGAGRYLDLVLVQGKIRLDFNTAYNPYCAYSEGYRCPLPPPENRLTVVIRAGEKAYKAGG